MGKTNSQKGITLIALIITIVVLLILAVVAIDAIQDDGGILAHAQNAAGTYNNAVANEQAALDKYLEYLTGANGGFDEYTVGMGVTLEDKNGNEQEFWVIKNSGKTDPQLRLMAKGCINTGTLLQADANNVEFSETNYWANNDGSIKSEYAEIKNDYGNTLYIDLTEKETPPAEKHYAAYAAYQYGEQFEMATGRLVTYSEISDIYDEKNILLGEDEELNYWYGSAYNASSVWSIYGDDGYASHSGYDSTSYGVRPVIEISKSSKSIVTEE